ncbi:hypothetical protein COD70_26260 [Bacillus cereus]|nr:hypothetical protein COD70_26260 [Bacillus cereus]
MQFKVLPARFKVTTDLAPGLYLVKDNWDDFTYKTQFDLYYIEKNNSKHCIGTIKIGQFDMKEARPNIPERFECLEGSFFSLGQSITYYEKLKALGDEIRETILSSLNDLARDSELFKKARDEEVTKTSLLRDVNSFTVREQFHRIANGGANLTKYSFTYDSPGLTGNLSGFNLNFEVTPNSNPPTNIHTLIGRNGVGKTTLINNMIKALVDTKKDILLNGKFLNVYDEFDEEIFANTILVAFSAFDDSYLIDNNNDETKGMLYSYIGLKERGPTKIIKYKEKTFKHKGNVTSKGVKQLSKEFADSIDVCIRTKRIERWKKSVKMLETDPIFESLNVSELVENNEDLEAFFKELSSGHKIVLLTITKLIEKVDEKTLVILDEPEAHLHPPLLSAFIRSLSGLLINQNAVGIIATHSPVILQEVPKSCVWKIRRSGKRIAVERPERETFGENIGILTNEVFGLEVTHSGFHSLLKEAIAKKKDYEGIIKYFNDELGLEARALIRSYISIQELDEE